MIIRLTVLGIEVFCLSLGNFILQDDSEDGGEEEPGTKIGGGSSHNFERDPVPLNPDDRYDWEFGFGKPKRVRKGGRGVSD